MMGLNGVLLYYVYVFQFSHLVKPNLLLCSVFSALMCRSARNNLLVYAISYGISKSTVFYLYAVVFRFGALLVIQPTDHFAYVPFFDVFRVFIAIVFGGAAIGQASAFAPDFTKAKLSANRIFFMLDRKPLIDNYSDEGQEPVSSLAVIGVGGKYFAKKFFYDTHEGSMLCFMLKTSFKSSLVYYFTVFL